MTGLLAACCLVLVPTIARGQDGTLDRPFNPAPDQPVGAVVLQTVGAEQKLLVGGYFNSIGGGGQSQLARLNADGTEDISFVGTANGNVSCLSLCADGDILVGGQFTTIGGGNHAGIARLAPNGTHRSTFTPSLVGEAFFIRELSNGKIIVGGIFNNVTGSNGTFSRKGIALLNADGTVDGAFNATLLGNPVAYVLTLDIQPSDGALLIGGTFTSVGGVPRGGVARISSATGALDTNFNVNTDGQDVIGIYHRPNGNVIFSGAFTNVNNTTRNGFTEVDSNGALTSWAPDFGGDSPRVFVTQGDGKLIAAGLFASVNGAQHRNIVRFHTNGTVDSAYNPGFPYSTDVYALALQSDGKVVLGGDFFWPPGVDARDYLARIHGPSVPSGPEIEVRNDSTLVAHNGTLNFGAVTYPGGTTSITLSINNTGTTNLNLTGLIATIGGAQSGAFSVPPYTVTTVAPGGQVSLVVQFSPTNLGLHTASLSIPNNDADETPYLINLSGNGAPLAPEIEVFDGLTPLEDSLSTIGLPAVSVGAPSGGSTRSIVVKNTGSAPLSGLVVTFDGPQSGDFKADGVVMLTHAELASGATWTFTLSFNPAATGLRDAVMHIASNDADENPFDVNYLGFGNAQVPPPAGGVPYAWGNNNTGTIGVGTANYQSYFNAPQAVLTTGALSGKTVTAVAAGASHSLALTADGKVFGWGYAVNGQLGSSSFASYREEAVASDASATLNNKTVTAIAAGYDHSLALTSDGLIFAWGENTAGKLGIGSSGPYPGVGTPTQVVTNSPGLLGKSVIAIAGGPHHSLALTSGGEVYAWGQNTSGELGTGINTADSFVPVKVQGLPDPNVATNRIVKIRIGGRQNFALTADGKLYAWGKNDYWQIGDGTTTNRTLPVLVGTTGDMAGKTIVDMGAGEYHALAVDSDGKLYAWGYGGYGALGTGDSIQRLNPTLIGGALATRQVTRIVAGYDYSLATTADNKVFVWGSNGSGQLGGATAVGAGTSLPMELVLSSILTGGKVVTDVSTGRYNHVLALVGDPPAPEIEVRLEFDNSLVTLGQLVNQGTAAVEGTWFSPYVTFKITNTGTTPLTGLLASVTGVHAADFDYSQPSPTTLLPGYSTNFNVSFTPVAVGTRSAALHIASNDADEGDFYVNLTGTGYYASTGERVDTGFNPNVEGGAVLDMAVQTNGQVIVAGNFTTVGGASHSHIARVEANGSVDNSFQTSANNSVLAVALQADGQIIIGGYFTSVTGTNGTFPRQYLARLNINGTVDETWYPSVNSYVLALAVEPGNTLLAGGIFSYANVTALVPRLARFDLTDNGGVYLNFVPGSGGTVDEIVLHDGKILVGGEFASMGGALRSNLARLNADGTADSFFTGTGCTGGGVRAIAVQPSDGKIVVGGAFDKVNGYTNYRIARLNPNGSLDGSFYSAVLDTVQAIQIQANGRIVIGGAFEQVWSDGNWVQWPRLARLNANGKIDYTFPAAAHYDFVRTLLAEPDGDLLVGGSFTYLNALPRNNFARIAVPAPDIHVVSTGGITHTDGSSRDLGTVLVGNTTPGTVFTIQNVGLAALTGFAGVGGITIDGPAASTFSISYPGNTSLATGATTTFTIAFAPLGQGPGTATLHIHSNDPDEEPFDITLTGAGGQPITDWRQQNFGTTSNTGDAADDADPDHDGISNLLEFATAGSPNTNGTAPTTIAPPGGGVIEFTYTRNKLAMAELTFQVQWSDDLLTTWSGVGVTETLLSDNGYTQQVKALVPTGGNDQRFVHLKVTRVP